MLEFDIETTGLQDYYHEMFMTQWLPSDDGPRVIYNKPEHEQAIQRMLDSAEREGGLQAWNSKFDFGFAHRAGYKLPHERHWHDGMLKAHIVDERSSWALKARGAKLFGEDERDDESRVQHWLKDERKRRKDISKETGAEYIPPNYSDVPAHLMEPYGIQDVELQRKVTEVYDRALANNDQLRDVYELERGVLAALFWAEQRGIPVERQAAINFEQELMESRDPKTAAVQELAGKDNFNPNAPRQVQEALERRGLDLSQLDSTPTGFRKMDEDNLEKLDDDLARAVLDWKKDDKLLSTYLNPLLHGKQDSKFGQGAPYITPEQRIHPNFRQVGAITGRMSAAEPNMQNWHRDDLRMRYMVRAEEGMKLVTADLDAIEMRLFAAFAGQGVLLDQVRQPDGDPHSFTAQMIGIEDKVRGNDITTARQRAKVFNFQMIYGGGIPTIMKEFGVSRSRANEMLQRYHKAYPEIAVLQDNIKAKLYDQGYITTPWGRRHRADPNKNINAQAYKFINKLVQGTAADLLKDALVKIHKDGIPVVLLVHDEIVAHVPEEDAVEAAHIIQKHMTEHERITRIVPVTAEAMIVDRWSDAKTPGYVPDYMKGR